MAPHKIKYKVTASMYAVIALTLLLIACRHETNTDSSGSESYILDPGNHFSQTNFNVSVSQTEYSYFAPFTVTTFNPQQGPAFGIAIDSTIGDYWTYEDIDMKITIKIFGENVFEGIPSDTIIDLSKPDADYRISVSVFVSDPNIAAGMGGAGGMGGPSSYAMYSAWVGDLVAYWENDPVMEWVSGTEGTLTISDFQINVASGSPPEYSYNVKLNDVVLYSEVDPQLPPLLSNGVILPNFLIINSATFCVSKIETNIGCS